MTYPKLLVGLFFACLLCLGIGIYKDYGMSWDEVHSMNNGLLTYNYIVHGDHALYELGMRYYHGAAFAVFLTFIEKIFNIQDIRDIHWMRHLLTFLLFYMGVYFFYRLCRLRFHSWKAGLLGAFFLIVSPRIFAEAFYNARDIPCLVFFILSIYTLIRFLDQKTFVRAVGHALTSALLIDVRVLGVLVPALTLFLMVLDLLRGWKAQGETGRFLSGALVYGVFLSGFTILFWPMLWEDPIRQMIRAFQVMSHYAWNREVLYLGQFIPAAQIPWHYALLWILVSTPLLYGASFLMGVGFCLKNFLMNPIRFYHTQRNDLIFLLWFFVPLLAIIVRHSVLYDGWRHVFFVYPAFLLIAMTGLNGVFQRIQSYFAGRGSSWLKWGLGAAILVALSSPIYFMVRYHPYQNLYFNALAGGMEKAKRNFELDYWGLSYLEGLKYILKQDPAPRIPVTFPAPGGQRSFRLLSPEERKRIVYVKDMKDAKYFLSNYRWHREEYPYPGEYYSVKIDGTKIMVVYKLK